MPFRLESKKIVTAVCGYCGKRAGSDNFPWVTSSLAQVGLREEGWTTKRGENCCPACKTKSESK